MRPINPGDGFLLALEGTAAYDRAMPKDDDLSAETSIALLPLTGPQINTLWKKGHRKFSDLSGVDLRGYRGFGPVIANRIHFWLRDLDLKGFPARKPRPSTQNILGLERRARVARMYESGMTIREIASAEDRSYSRIWQLVTLYRRAKKRAALRTEIALGIRDTHHPA